MPTNSKIRIIGMIAPLFLMLITDSLFWTTRSPLKPC